MVADDEQREVVVKSDPRVRGTERALRRERIAVASLFAVTGTTSGTFAARIPAVQDRLGLAEGELGIAFAALMAAAFAGLLGAGFFITRLGSRKVLLASLLVFVPVLAVLPVAPGLVALSALLVLFGTTNSGIDVAINAQGSHVERGYGRPVLSSLHAMYSAGALGAAGLAALLAAADVSVVTHFGVVAAILTPLGVIAISWMTDEPRDPERVPRLAVPSKALLIPGVILFCMVFAEDIAYTWSAVYLRRVAAGTAAVAAAGFALYSAGMLVGRLVADRLVTARGASFTVTGGAIIGVAGVAAAVAVPEAAVGAVGLLLLGLGLSPVFPVIYGVVGERDPLDAGRAIAAVTTVGYLGSVVGPPTIGGLAELIGLRASFLLVPAATLLMALLAQRLQPDR